MPASLILLHLLLIFTLLETVHSPVSNNFLIVFFHSVLSLFYRYNIFVNLSGDFWPGWSKSEIGSKMVLVLMQWTINSTTVVLNASLVVG